MPVLRQVRFSRSIPDDSSFWTLRTQPYHDRVTLLGSARRIKG